VQKLRVAGQRKYGWRAVATRSGAGGAAGTAGGAQTGGVMRAGVAGREAETVASANTPPIYGLENNPGARKGRRTANATSSILPAPVPFALSGMPATSAPSATSGVQPPRTGRRITTVPGAVSGPDDSEAASILADRTWKLLDTNHSAIDRADAKAAAVVAACGACAAALVAVCDTHRISPAAAVSALLCAALTLASMSCAGLALRPRRLRSERPGSLVYFDHVARTSSRSAEAYTRSVLSLFADAEALAADISFQIWATARLATAKYDWLDRAIVLLFGNFLALSLTVLLLAV